MNTFRKTILGIATILLILALIMVGVSIANSKYNQKFPPIIAECPDYWTRSGKYCVNNKKLGGTNCHRNMDFTSSSQWTGTNGLCEKKKWAKLCNLTWDGVTNNMNACK